MIEAAGSSAASQTCRQAARMTRKYWVQLQPVSSQQNVPPTPAPDRYQTTVCAVFVYSGVVLRDPSLCFFAVSSCRHSSKTASGRQTTSKHIRERFTGSARMQRWVGGICLCTTGHRRLTFPKSLTSKRSNDSNSSLFFMPNTSLHASRNVRMFFRHRNCVGRQKRFVYEGFR